MSQQIVKKYYKFPLAFLIGTVLSVFIAEIFVMSLVMKLIGPEQSQAKLTFFNAIILTTVLIPQLYLFLYRPLRYNIEQLREAEAELQKNNEVLENKVKERTMELEKLSLLLQDEYQQELQLSEERHKKITDNIGVGITVIDSNMNLRFVNKSMKKWFPSLEFTIDTPCYKVFKTYNEDKICSDCPVVQAFRTGKTHKSEHKVKLGVLIKYYKIIASPVLNEHDQVTSVIETSIDITEKKMAELKIKKLNRELESLVHVKEASLKDSEEKYRSLLKNSSEGIFIFDPARQIILEANTSFITLLGYSEVEILQLTLAEFYADQTDINDSVKRLVEKGENVHGVRAYRKKDGQLVEVQVSISSVSYGNKTVCLANVHDITSLKKSALALEESNRKLADALKETVNALVTVGEKRDPYTAGHQHRVAQLSEAIGKELGLSDKQLEALSIAGTLHDIGKIHIPSDILNKPGRLTKLEFELIQTHPEISHDIINRIPFELPVAEIVIQHHERLDGSGYPKGLKGEEIYLEAKILAVADVVEAMASHRPYRPAIGLDKAMEEIKAGIGTHYDQQVVEACVRLINEKGFHFN